METNVGNIISSHEADLINYLVGQVSTTIGFIKREERGIEILTQDVEFGEAVDEVIQEKTSNVNKLKFRLAYLNSQIQTVRELNK